MRASHRPTRCDRREDDASDTSTLFEWMPGSGALAPLEQIVAQWKDERDNDQEDDEPEAEGGIYTVMSHPRRIPIAGSRWWDGDNTYLDLHPAPKGTEGQLIMFTSECDPALLGTSFRAALESYLQALDSGEWVFDAKKGHVRDAALRSRHLELPQGGLAGDGCRGGQDVRGRREAREEQARREMRGRRVPMLGSGGADGRERRRRGPRSRGDRTLAPRRGVRGDALRPVPSPP